jgi:hypothetical protein
VSGGGPYQRCRPVCLYGLSIGSASAGGNPRSGTSQNGGTATGETRPDAQRERRAAESYSARVEKHVRIWFDGVPLIEVGPLANEILARGWQYRHSLPGEWWCEFVRGFGNETDFERELEAVKGLFDGRWTRVGVRRENGEFDLAQKPLH